MAKLNNLPPELLFEISTHLRPAAGFTKRRIWEQRLESWPWHAEPEPDYLTSLSCACKQLRNVLFPRAVFHSVVLCGPGSFGKLLALLGIFSSPGVVSSIPSVLRAFSSTAPRRADELLPALEALSVAVALQNKEPYESAAEYYMYDDVVSKMSEVMRPARELFVHRMQASCAPGRGFWSTRPRLEHLSALVLTDVPVNSGFTSALGRFENLSKFVYIIDGGSNLSRADSEFVTARRIVEALGERSSHTLRTLSLENFVNLENLWIDSREFHYLTTEPLPHTGMNDTEQEQRNSLLMTLPPFLKRLHIWGASDILKWSLFWLAVHCKPGTMLDEVALGRYEGEEDLSPLYEAFREVGARASGEVDVNPELWTVSDDGADSKSGNGSDGQQQRQGYDVEN
ncbi:hypothetical protein CSOJ01_15862 [Colletotrichum sojae]|uniref:Uncharacterized protein n=1 Tax=Colletotrichum sojae TaxID=2175907 RepID=A0A8H6IL89_9PEZI|nr:hypothetical protein CSOJ01_15862 [Colletotrichum sojae]